MFGLLIVVGVLLVVAVATSPIHPPAPAKPSTGQPSTETMLVSAPVAGEVPQVPAGDVAEWTNREDQTTADYAGEATIGGGDEGSALAIEEIKA